MPLTSTSGFTKELSKKIHKTKEARNGEGIFKRRNRRNYRVVMQLSTYKNIYSKNKSLLDKYEDGYAVRIRPEDYFHNNGTIQPNFPASLKLGYNAFIYFKTITSWHNFHKFCSNFREVVELKTQPDITSVFDSWIGEYCYYVKHPIMRQIF